MLSALSPSAAASGLALGLGLIVAIGAQNAFVLRQGLRLEHVTAVVAVCTASDLALISAGVLGAGAALPRVPWLIPAVCSAGAAFLLTYGFHAARRALRPGTLQPETTGARTGLAVTVTTCLALTWLNPHVYLDTAILLGSMSSTYGPHRWEFAAGAGLGSLAWFTALGYGARLLRPAFARPFAWRVLDGTIAAIMTVLGISLAVHGVAAVLVSTGVTAIVLTTLAGRRRRGRTLAEDTADRVVAGRAGRPGHPHDLPSRSRGNDRARRHERMACWARGRLLIGSRGTSGVCR